MRLVLFGVSAFSYWLTAAAPPNWLHAADESCLARCNPTQEAVDGLAAGLPQIGEPLHCLVPGACHKHVGGVETHVTRRPYPRGSFLRVAEEVYVPCPELCFVQAAQLATLHELVKIGSALCGAFYLDPWASGGLRARAPLTSRARIEAFMASCPGLKGAQAARRALPLLMEGAASPPEIFLRMVLGLPTFYGGYGLRGSCANYRMEVSRDAQAISGCSTLVPDLYWPEHRLVVEYDSNAEHLTSDQAVRDSKKRLALTRDGFKVITVTTRQLGQPGSMRYVAQEVARSLGRAFRLRGRQFPAKHAALYRAGWSLNGYCRAEWLKGDFGAPR